MTAPSYIWPWILSGYVIYNSSCNITYFARNVRGIYGGGLGGGSGAHDFLAHGVLTFLLQCQLTADAAHMKADVTGCRLHTFLYSHNAFDATPPPPGRPAHPQGGGAGGGGGVKPCLTFLSLFPGLF